MSILAALCATPIAWLAAPQQIPQAQPCLVGTWPRTSAVSGITETPGDPCDFFFIDGPPAASIPSGGAPLLVLFHGFGGRYDEYADPNGDWGDFPLFDVAKQRGWFVLMHDGGQNAGLCAGPVSTPCSPTSGVFATLGAEPFMIHTERVLEHVLCSYPIDRQRIYGYGFSMGGDELMAYAARHLDPTAPHGMFAALISQSATSPIFENVCQGTLSIGCNYGATLFDDYCPAGPAERFLWQRATVLAPDCAAAMQCGVFDPADLDFWNSQILNIQDLPIRLQYHEAEGFTVMTGTNLMLNTRLGGNALEVLSCTNPVGDCGPWTWDKCDAPHHEWEDACALRAVDFLEGAPENTLQGYLDQVKHGGGVLIAADGVRHYAFEVQRASPDEFGRIAWTADAPANRLDLLTYSSPAGYAPNLSEVRIIADHGDPTAVLDASMLPLDVRPSYSLDALEITGFVSGSPPTSVAYLPGAFGIPWTNWSYTPPQNGQSGVMRIQGVRPGRYVIH